LLPIGTQPPFNAVFFEDSGAVSVPAGKRKASQIGLILVLEWRVVATRVIRDMLTMHVIIRRTVVNGPKNIHDAIQ